MAELLHLYEHYAYDGKLLRTGITNSPHDRTGQYETEDYWPAVEWIHVEHFWTTRDRILELERNRIREMRPPFNRQHNPAWSLQEPQRARYLGQPVHPLRRGHIWVERIRRGALAAVMWVLFMMLVFVAGMAAMSWFGW